MIYIAKSLKESLRKDKNNRYLIFIVKIGIKPMVLIFSQKMCFQRKSFTLEVNCANVLRPFTVNLKKYTYCIDTLSERNQS